jgi:acyl-CoA synthetase (AMP-forming)/AMP-acid ligase II
VVLSSAETGVEALAARIPERVNIARLLPEQALEVPDRPAVRVASGLGARFRLEGVSYAELEARSSRVARALRERGLRPGDRACLFVRPGVELIALTFALLKAGVVPVLIDPGMGRRNLLRCVERMQPRAFLGVPLAHAIRRVFPRAFRTVELSVVVGGRWPLGGLALEELVRGVDDAPFVEDTARDDEAAILFTSGSTGPPKGVVYTHGNFLAQVLALKELYRFEPGEVDAACFPLFALFSPGLELSCVFPELDPSRPASCDPERIVEALRRTEATSTFGSPAIWRRVVPWCVERGVRLPHLRRVLIAGAPVPPALVEGFHRVLEGDADVHTPYGATESLPVSSISGREILELHRARRGTLSGTCVGRPAPGVELEVMRITDEPVASWSEDLRAPAGEPGELVVRGPVVTREYKFEEEPTRRAKLDAGSALRHRIGDVVRVDGEGRLWFQGRKSHRIETEEGLVMPVPVEVVFNELEGIHRTALVGVGDPGRQRPVLVVECEPGARPRGARRRAALVERLRARAAEIPDLPPIAAYLFHPGFPVDVRHNAKIHRGELAAWAEGELS